MTIKMPIGAYQEPMDGVAKLNRLSKNYKIYEKPQSPVEKFGYLAYVSDAQRKKILDAGCGEKDDHILHIKSHIGYLKKYQKPRLKAEQTTFNF